MTAVVTKSPAFKTDAEIKAENERRKKSIAAFKKKSKDQIRAAIQCSLAADIGRPRTPKPGEVLYIYEKWRIRPADRFELKSLRTLKHTLESHYYGSDFDPTKRIEKIDERIAEIIRRGSDFLRASVARAADWACVPAELLAAVLQNENSQFAKGYQRFLQNTERSLQAWDESGSTGFGNVKPETLEHVKSVFRQYYGWPILGTGVKNVGQNKNVDTDIFHAAAVLRDGLNKAWSVARSLNADQFRKYKYYPYFGGTVTKEVAIRAMGHYNGMGDAALKYGKDAMNRITNQKLYFLPQPK